MEDKFVRMVPHPTFGQVGLIAGNFATDSADKRVVFVQITFKAVGSDPGAIDAWKKRMPGFMKSYKLPELPAGMYRFFDSEHVLLGTAKPKVVETYAEKSLLSMSGSDLVIVGESPSPKGFVGTFGLGGGSEFIGLVRSGEQVQILLVYEVDKVFQVKTAKLDFDGLAVPVTESPKPAATSSSIIWHNEVWKSDK
jgi:hypothetical protein